MELDKQQLLKKGIDLISVPEFAANHTVKTETIYYAMRNGKIDYVNFGTQDTPAYQIVMTDTTRAYSPNKHKHRV